MNTALVRCDTRLRAEGKIFPALSLSTKVQSLHTEIKRVDPDSRQTGRAANMTLPAAARNRYNEVRKLLPLNTRKAIYSHKRTTTGFYAEPDETISHLQDVLT
jgi:hypothetical protein